jgi:site-specific DNA recombinase
MENRNKKAVAYVRISSTMQKDNESPDTQREKIKQYASANDIEIIKDGWFFDEAKSGKNAEREELQHLLQFALAHKDKIDHVIVYKMNRASRDLYSYITQVKMVLKAKGITVRSATEPVDDTKMGRFMEGLFVMLGQLDNDSKSEYTLDNMRSLAQQGYYQHPPVVGYKTIKIPNQMGKPRPSLMPDEMAPKVKKVLERFSSGDISKAELTRYARRIGLKSRYGTKVSEDTINRLLKSATYAGYICDSFTDYQPVEGKHEGLITPKTFELNQALLYGQLSRKDEVHKKKNENYVLRATLRCFGCDKPLYASAPRTGNGGHSPRYHCGRGCKSPSIKAELVHEDFIEMLKDIKPSEKILKLYKRILIQEANWALGTLNGRVSTLRRELDDISQRRVNGIEMFAAGQLTIEEKSSLIDALDTKKLEANLKLNQLEQQQNIREADIESAINFMGRIDKQWQFSNFDNRQRFQNMIFPHGITYDLENRKFGTSEMSILYRSAVMKTTSEEAVKSHLVAGPGLEPGTSWL